VAEFVDDVKRRFSDEILAVKQRFLEEVLVVKQRFLDEVLARESLGCLVDAAPQAKVDTPPADLGCADASCAGDDESAVSTQPLDADP